MKTSGQHDRSTEQADDFETRQLRVVEHPIKFEQRDQTKDADQQPKENFVPGKRDQERDRPQHDRADEPQNENGARLFRL